MDGFLATEFISPSVKIAARRTLAEAEVNAIRDCDLFILCIPGGSGSMFEYGLALGLGKPVIVFSPSWALLEEEAGHFISIDGPHLVVGHPDLLIERIARYRATKMVLDTANRSNK